jgi:hypothetical protein
MGTKKKGPLKYMIEKINTNLTVIQSVYSEIWNHSQTFKKTMPPTLISNSYNILRSPKPRPHLGML